jgi:hypothetical protein
LWSLFVSVGTVRGLPVTSGDFLDFKFLLDFNMVGKKPALPKLPRFYWRLCITYTPEILQAECSPNNRNLPNILLRSPHDCNGPH